MKINLKYFLLGMILALGPVFIWAEIKLKASYNIIGKELPNNITINSDYANYDYFEPRQALAYTSYYSPTNQVQPTSVPTNTPIPTITQRPIAQVAAQERVNTPTTAPAVVNLTAPSEYDALIDKYAVEYGADPNLMKKIAKCESGYNPEAVSPSGAYHGMYQFVASTWVSNREAMGLDPNPDLRRNAEEAIRTAAFKMGRDGYGAWPHCSRI